MNIAIIGHGASANGRRWRDLIDGCDTVVRMWDCDWQDPRDYGERYDVGLVNADRRSVEAFIQSVRRAPAEWWVYDLGHMPNLPDATVIDPAPWCERAVALGGETTRDRLNLTRGCVAAAHAITLRPERVFLVGFDAIRDGGVLRPMYTRGFCDQAVARYGPGGQRESGFPIGTVRTKTHDFSVEGRLLADLAAEHEVDLCHAEDIW